MCCLAEDVLVAKDIDRLCVISHFCSADMREWLPADHPVWTVLAIVDGLDTRRFISVAGSAGWAGRAMTRTCC